MKSKKHLFKVGDKVNIPTQKTAERWGGISGSVAVNSAKKQKLKYLFVTDVGEYITCDCTESGGGDYFTESDLTLYEEDTNTNTMVIVKKEDLEKIHEVACSAWKSSIEEMAKRNVFGDTVELDQVEIKQMFDAAFDGKQIKVLEEIFGKQQNDLNFVSDNLNNLVDGIKVFGVALDPIHDSFIGLPRLEESRNYFYLNDNYKWEIDNHKLIVTRK